MREDDIEPPPENTTRNYTTDAPSGRATPNFCQSAPPPVSVPSLSTKNISSQKPPPLVSSPTGPNTNLDIVRALGRVIDQLDHLQLQIDQGYGRKSALETRVNEAGSTTEGPPPREGLNHPTVVPNVYIGETASDIYMSVVSRSRHTCKTTKND